uniref:Uncharacterized protein LOC110200371 n=1 Tax=Phascolarctos cinereus TaxID=38626 RepID=A0A6P5JAF9_PHACI|nr:uncharacterized protein LOC110200371 [Phascolarctos cinereus]
MALSTEQLKWSCVPRSTGPGPGKGCHMLPQVPGSSCLTWSPEPELGAGSLEPGVGSRDCSRGHLDLPARRLCWLPGSGLARDGTDRIGSPVPRACTSTPGAPRTRRARASRLTAWRLGSAGLGCGSSPTGRGHLLSAVRPPRVQAGSGGESLNCWPPTELFVNEAMEKKMERILAWDSWLTPSVTLATSGICTEQPMCTHLRQNVCTCYKWLPPLWASLFQEAILHLARCQVLSQHPVFLGLHFIFTPPSFSLSTT